MEENWIDIPDLKGFYKISDQGRVKSLDRVVAQSTKGLTMLRKGKILKPQVNKRNGYVYISLCKDGKVQRHRLHRLVLMSFGGVLMSKDIDCMHLDSNKLNNSLSNLRWGSKSCNQAFRVDNKTSTELEKHPCTRLSNKDVLKISSMLKKGLSHGDIAEDFPVSVSTISAINNGQNWSVLTGRGYHG